MSTTTYKTAATFTLVDANDSTVTRAFTVAHPLPPAQSETLVANVAKFGTAYNEFYDSSTVVESVAYVYTTTDTVYKRES